jgi:hypothetical protein
MTTIAKHQLTEVEKQFVEQCDRFWRPYGIKLHELVDKHVNLNEPPEEKLQQIRLAVTAALEEAVQGRKLNQIEFMMELDHLMQRPGLTWEVVERKSVRV